MKLFEMESAREHFTLIELLIVMAAIAVLACLLRSSKRIACIWNCG